MYSGELSAAPARDAVQVAAGATDLGDVRGLLSTADVSVDLVTANGKTRAGYPLQKGYNPIGVRQVTAIGGAATVWALY